jgi:hypothetical protein
MKEKLFPIAMVEPTPWLKPRRLNIRCGTPELANSTIKLTTGFKRERIFFNKMLPLSIVNGNELPVLITLVMTPK